MKSKYRNPFEVMVDDIFAARDFVESFYWRGRDIPCVVTAVTEREVYTEFGRDDTVDFSLQVRVSDLADELKKNERIQYRNIEYRVDYKVMDSAGLTYTVYLKR